VSEALASASATIVDVKTVSAEEHQKSLWVPGAPANRRLCSVYGRVGSARVLLEAASYLQSAESRLPKRQTI
jgi:hypothetical protein